MIFIIGVKHEIQYLFDCNSASTEKFKEYLKTEAVNRDVTLIAEELNNEAILRVKAIGSVAKDVALSIDVNHIFCDPDSKTRENLGISNRQIRRKNNLPETGALRGEQIDIFDKAKAECHAIREKYWFSLFKDQASSNMIFICGDDHVDNFKKLVANSGYPTKVLSRNWRKLKGGN